MKKEENMTTRLENLLEEIDPFGQIERYYKRMNSAIGSFSYDSITIQNWPEYENYIAKYHCHLENTTLNVNMPVHPELHYQRCIRFLKEEFGPNGEKIAYKMAKTGVNGGLYTVLYIIAKRLAEFYARNTIVAFVDKYWNKLSNSERIAAAKEYRKKYAHLFPLDYAEKSPEFIAANLQKILEEHSFMVKRIRKFMRQKKI
jgi:hypothetical protein